MQFIPLNTAKTKFRLGLILLLWGATLAVVPGVYAETITANFRYVAKFVCCPATVSTEVVIPGAYATEINVHNPSLDKTVKFVKKFAFTHFDGQRPQTIGGVIPFRLAPPLGPDQALDIDCRDFAEPTLAPLETGFVVIFSEAPLDVIAVYTAGESAGPFPSGTPGAAGTVKSIDVETITEQKIRPTPIDVSTEVPTAPPGVPLEVPLEVPPEEPTP